MLKIFFGSAIMVFALATLDTNNSLMQSYYCTNSAVGIVANRCYNGVMGIEALYIFSIGALIGLYGFWQHRQTVKNR